MNKSRLLLLSKIRSSKASKKKNLCKIKIKLIVHLNENNKTSYKPSNIKSSNIKRTNNENGIMRSGNTYKFIMDKPPNDRWCTIL